MGLSIDEIRDCLHLKLSISDKHKKFEIEIEEIKIKMCELKFLDTRVDEHVIDSFDMFNLVTIPRDIVANSYGDFLDAFYSFIEEMITRKEKLVELKRYIFETSRRFGALCIRQRTKGSESRTHRTQNRTQKLHM